MSLLRYLPENRRPVIGLVAILLLAVGGGLTIWSSDSPAAMPLLRMGIVIGVLWLAMPELQNPRNRWWMLGLLAVVVAVIVLPRYLSVSLTKLVPLIVVAIVAFRILRAVTAGRARR
jgi:hypothetical protein